jgi:peptidoglycan/xylan/chitin deacetylase (PgdA/CDA1 family)
VKLRSHIVALALLAVVLAGFLYSTFRSNEPRHDGRTLGFWLREIEASPDAGTERWQRAARAVHQMGTNAIPALLTMLQTPDSKWKTDAVDWLQETVDLDLTETLGSIRGRRAIIGFRLLGPAAAGAALPKLAALATDRDPRISSQALAALGEIGGQETIPTLVAVLAGGNPAARAQAAGSLGALRGHGRAAVPALVAALRDSDSNLRANAARALGEIALDAGRAVPALTEALADTNATVRSAAALALGYFGNEAEGALPAIRELTFNLDAFGARVLPRTLVRVQCELHDGGIIRGPKTEKRLALVFTGHEFAEGGETILHELTKHGGQASFFFTGAFLSNSNFAPLIQRIADERHYLGPHSDRHLLYCAWEDRRTLVSETDFATDLLANVAKIPTRAGEDRRFSRFFLPPFEHYNRELADWTRKLRWTLINFTPGTRSNADYTGEADKNFVSAQAIFDSIVARERGDPNGLNGFILLLHVGSGPGRADKFHMRFGELLDYLAGKGYEFVRVDQLLGPRPQEPK